MQKLYAVYLKREVLDKAEDHFKLKAAAKLEAMGLLTGSVYACDGKNFVVVDDYVTAENESSAVSVRFSRNAFQDLALQISSTAENALVVGWMHSHPGYGCFLSATDLETQKNYFPEKFNVAVVGDPLKKENGRMLLRAYRLAGDGYEEVSYAVIEKKS